MKKVLVVFTVFASSASAFVGQQSTYRVTVGDSKVNQYYTETLRITAFDEKRQEYLIEEKQSRLGSQDVIRTYKSSSQNLLRLKDTFKDCEKYQGVREVIAISENKVEACSLPILGDFEEGIIYYGDTPFGILKKQTQVPGTKVMRTRELVN